MDENALVSLVAPELERWKVPGVEVVVVRSDEVVYAGGLGLRDVARRLPVTPKTLFHHGSTGKAFTGILAATLVDEGLLEWDKPVREYLPDFRLHDPVVSERVTIRDLLSHRSGLARHEFMWVANPSWDRSELVRRVRYLEPTHDFRTTWQYWNPGYAIAGHVIGAVTGSSWEVELPKRVLEPLGMTRAFSSLEPVQRDDDHSLPYSIEDDTPAEQPFRSIDLCAPAGQLVYPATDSARWLRFQCGHGERIVSDEAFNETRSIQIPFSIPSAVEDWGPSFVGYGLGWVIGTYRNRPILWHSGGIDGFYTEALVLTQDEIGILVCANVFPTEIVPALVYSIADRMLGSDDRPWLDKLHEMRGESSPAPEETVVEGTSPSHSLADYAGDYSHPAYGMFAVSAASELGFKIGELDLTASYRHYDTWTATYPPFGSEGFPVTFVTGADGAVAEVRVGLEPTTEPITFTRIT